MTRRYCALVFVALTAIIAKAQTGPRFEATSVKPALEQPVGSTQAGIQIPQRSARLSNVSLKDLVGFAVLCVQMVCRREGEESIGTPELSVSHAIGTP